MGFVASRRRNHLSFRAPGQCRETDSAMIALSLEVTKQIIVCEDNPVDLMLIRRSLAQAGIPFAATVLEDGGKAFRYASDVTLEKPDLIIIDLNMPQYDGFEILEAIKKNPALADVPCAVMTSSFSKRDRERAESLGAAQFVSKPTDMDEFLKTGLIFKSLIESRKDMPLPSGS
jgi:CheY-like chemotaxis protein